MTTKQKAPATEPPVTRAKSNQTERILQLFQLVRRALIAIFLSPVYQTAIAVVATVGIILMGGRA
jgi:hypothetical protein